jgi:hypothetical protein
MGFRRCRYTNKYDIKSTKHSFNLYYVCTQSLKFIDIVLDNAGIVQCLPIDSLSSKHIKVLRIQFRLYKKIFYAINFLDLVEVYMILENIFKVSEKE